MNLTPPSGSNCSARHTDKGLQLDVPQQGFRGPAASLRILGIAMLVVPALIAALMLTVGLDGIMLVALIVPAVLCTVGFFVLRSGKKIAQTRSQLRFLDDGRVEIEVEAPGDHREYRWDKGEVRRIEVAPSNLTVNNRRLMQVEIEWPDGTVKLWRGRDTRELEWIATTARGALGL